MNLERYYMVSEKVLPDIFLKVIKVKELIYTGEVKDITEGAKSVGISRSAYYKYKDYIFPISDSINSKKITLAILLKHESGALSRILEKLAENYANVLTINQDIPINMMASVTITLDISTMPIKIKSLLEELSELHCVIKARLFAKE